MFACVCVCMHVQRSAQTALEESEKTFAEIISFIEKKRSEVRDLIQAQEKIAVSRAKVFLKQMEEEITELQRRDEELQQLSLTEDHIHFLQVLVFIFRKSTGVTDLSKNKLCFQKNIIIHVFWFSCLQRYIFLTATLGSSNLPTITVSSVLSFKAVAMSVTELKKHLEDFCKEDMEKIENRGNIHIFFVFTVALIYLVYFFLLNNKCNNL